MSGLTYKILEKNRQKNWTGWGKYFLDKIQRQNKSSKIKIDKPDSFKIMNYCSPRDTVKKMTRQVTDWEKIFVKMYCKRLVARLFKELLWLCNKRETKGQKV